MATAATTGHCDNCFNRHVTSDAVRWCPDCEEALCETCLQHHNAAKLLKSHETVAVVDNNKLPDFISELRTYCSEHDEKLELYCMRHQECCCLSCVKEKHHECTVYETVKNVVKGVKTSPAFEDVDHALGDVIKNFDAIIQNRTTNKARISKQSTVKLREIKEMREIVNQHLDLIEQALVIQLSEEVDGLNSSLKEQVRNVSEKKARAEELKGQFENIKEYATEIQAFLCIKRLEGRVYEDLQFQNEIVNGSTEVDIGVEFSDAIKSFMDVVFGSIKDIKSVPAVKLVTRKEEQAQITMPVTKSERLSPVVISQICSEVRIKPYPDLCESLDKLDIAIRFLESVGSYPSSLLYDFMAQTLKIEISILSPKAQQSIRCKHAMSLWITLALERAKFFAKYNKVAFERVSENFKQSLSEEQTQIIVDIVNTLPVELIDILVGVVFECIVLKVDVPQNPDDDDFVDVSKICLRDTLIGYIEACPFQGDFSLDEGIIDVISRLPSNKEDKNRILTAQSIEVWTLIYKVFTHKQRLRL